MSEEQRKFPRIASHHAVLVRKIGVQQNEEFAATKTMGLGGCSFYSADSFSLGTLLVILISLRQDVIKVKAKVVYEQLIGDGKREIGVEYMALSETDRERIKQLFEPA